MDQIDGRKILWENLSALMLIKYGKENMSKLAEDAHIGAATMTRIKEQKTSVGTENLDKLAKAFKVQAWQLICPGFDFSGDKPQTGAPNTPARHGKDLQFLYDMIPLESPQREPAYQVCLKTLTKAIAGVLPLTANQPTGDTAPAANQEKRHA